MQKESRREKFMRLAVARGNRILREIELLGNLSNRNNYEYTPEQVRAVFSAIEEELRIAKQRFTERGAQAKREIVL